jgi:serine acetyltransferase
MTLYETLRLFKADLRRRIWLENQKFTLWQALKILYKRGVVLVFIYRLKRYFFLKNSKPFKLFIWLLRIPEYQYCHSEIDPAADIAEGLVLSDFGGIGISFYNIIGKNCTFVGRGTPTLGAMEDVNHAEDKIKIGDYCVIGPNVRIVNPVSIASGTQIKANSVVMSSISKEGSLVSGFPAKEIAVIPIQMVMQWSPILSRSVQAS